MKNRILKSTGVLMLILVCIFGSTFNANAASEQAEGITGVTDDSDVIQPWSFYLVGYSITFASSATIEHITIETTAATRINKIYHDVVIYKNGQKILDSRYEGSNIGELITPISFPVKSGDKFTVIVDHCTLHNGLLESVHNEKFDIFP